MSKVSQNISNYVFNVGRGAKWFGISIIGQTVPRYITVSQGDNTYFRVSEEKAKEAIKLLAVALKAAGFSRGTYLSEVLDCDNSALYSYSKLVNEIFPSLYAGNVPYGQYDVGMFSYMRDDGERHRVAYIITDISKWIFIDTYEINGSIIRELSPTERAAGEIIR